MPRTTTKKSRAKATSKSPAKTAAKTTAKTVSSNVLNMITKWQIGLAVIFIVQAAVILVLSKTQSLPVTTSFVTRDTLASANGGNVLVAASRHLFDVDLAYFVAAILAIAAVAHVVIGTVYRQNYQADLARGVNKVRWVKTGIVETLIMVLIAMLVGVYDLPSLFMIVVLNVVASLTFLYLEVRRPADKKARWLVGDIGLKAVIAPWVVFLLYIGGGWLYGSNLPAYVYGVVGSMAILFIAYGLNICWQHKGSGHWADYLFGERLAMVISLVAISALAWQVFFGALK